MHVIIHLEFNKVKPDVMEETREQPKWIDQLSDEDLAFIKRFVLASGSLKALAGVYGISYPTVRLRLDRLIEKVKVIDDIRITDGFERLARMLYAEGKLEAETLRVLLAAHRKDENAEDEERSRNP